MRVMRGWMALWSLTLIGGTGAAALGGDDCTQGVPTAQNGGNGWSVAMSADGTTALVGAPFWEGDGFVRVFDRDGDAWAEQPSLAPAPVFNENAAFGWSVALSDDGDTAVIGAPFQGFVPFGAGAAYVFVRDGSGVWTEQAQIQHPAPLLHGNFGCSVAISGDGDTVVIGQVFQAYNFPDPQTDSAWVSVRTGEAWSAPAELTAPGQDDNWQFGASVAISPDGQWIGVGAPGPLQQNQTRAVLLQRSGDAFEHVQTIDYSPANGLNYFGASVALSNDTFVVCDPFNDEDVPGADQTNAGAIFIYELDGASWGLAAGPVFSPEPGMFGGFGSSAALRAGHMLIGGEQAGVIFSGKAFKLAKVKDEWVVTGSVAAPDPMNFGEFGRSVGLDASGAAWIIGEPGVDLDGDFENDGRVYFSTGLVESAPYEFAPASAQIDLTLVFPGLGGVDLSVEVLGALVAAFTGCDVATEMTLTSVELQPAEDPITVELPLLPDLTFTGLTATLAAVGPPAAVGPDGSAQLTGYEVDVAGFVAFGVAEPLPVDWFGVLPAIDVQLIPDGGGGPGLIELSVEPTESQVIDIGLGDLNPTALIGGAAVATPAPPPGCSADLTGDGGTDSLDLNALLLDFGCAGGGCGADLDGDGATGSTDLNLLLADFGCGV